MSTNPCAVRRSSSTCHVFNQAAITDHNSDTTAGGGFRRPLAVQVPLTLRALASGYGSELTESR